MTRTQGQGPAGEKGYPGEKGYFSAGYTTLRMPALFRRTISFAVKTPSDEGNDSACPSSKEQFELANLLAGELRELGIEDVVVSEKCFVYAKVPATAGCEGARKLGLIAHMDTVSQFCDGKITPVLYEDYDGRDLVLGTSGRTLSVGDFSHLAELRGRTLLTSDGTTILGVDDKAGIAEIMGALERVLRDGTSHGALRIAFTPDEEIGTGAGNFDAASFDCRKQTLRHIAKVMNERWGEGTVTLRIKDEYQNMESVIEGCMFTIDNARLACERAGVVPRVTPIRGGTDGCQLSFRGLPCPNLGTGGEGYHGPYEHATVEGINAATDVVAELIKVYAEA